MNRDKNDVDRSDFIPPSAYDVLLSDVNHSLLMGSIASLLEVQYLRTVSNDELLYDQSQTSFHGKLYGANYRCMIRLIVASKHYKKFVEIIFLVDTGSPHLYLCDIALQAMGFQENIPADFDILFRGMTFPASISPKTLPDGRPGNYHDINLIGSNFLKVAGGELSVNYPSGDVQIQFPEMSSRVKQHTRTSDQKSHWWCDLW